MKASNYGVICGQLVTNEEQFFNLIEEKMGADALILAKDIYQNKTSNYSTIWEQIKSLEDELYLLKQKAAKIYSDEEDDE